MNFFRHIPRSARPQISPGVLQHGLNMKTIAEGVETQVRPYLYVREIAWVNGKPKASRTPSELARRGKNSGAAITCAKIGLGLLAARGSRLPLYYSVYPGNLHDSNYFKAVMDEMFGIVCGLPTQQLTLSAAAMKDRGEKFTAQASMARLFASEMVNRVTAKALQIHGGYGFIKDYPVERFYRDARVFTIYEGTSEIQRVVISNHILKDKRRP
jgi:alkylation response protein AidB-like acyl-CoA dehydrogenase